MRKSNTISTQTHAQHMAKTVHDILQVGIKHVKNLQHILAVAALHGIELNKLHTNMQTCKVKTFCSAT